MSQTFHRKKAIKYSDIIPRTANYLQIEIIAMVIMIITMSQFQAHMLMPTPPAQPQKQKPQPAMQRPTKSANIYPAIQYSQPCSSSHWDSKCFASQSSWLGLGSGAIAITADSRQTTYLFQRLSLILQMARQWKPVIYPFISLQCQKLCACGPQIILTEDRLCSMPAAAL